MTSMCLPRSSRIRKNGSSWRLKKAGHVVGYGGDGINDASALHAADVGVSVESAVDVAKEAADIVLLEKDLGILVEGVLEGRRTFANTLKYVFMATSANFGNMFSMAGASLFLSFLPLLPKQILLTNLLTDVPEMTIAGDRVDEELIDRPRRWNIAFIRKFMLTFGLVSSIFDYITFACAALGLSRRCRGIQNRVVCGVGDLRLDHRPGRSESPAVHSQPTEPWPAGCDARSRRTDAAVALYAAAGAAGVRAVAAAVPGGLALHRRRVCRCG